MPRLVADPLVLAQTDGLVMVVRQFNADGMQRFRGEVVDSTGWRTTARLIERRYLAPLPYGASLDTSIEIDGVERRFVNEETAIAAAAYVEKSKVAEVPAKQEVQSIDTSDEDDDDDPVREAPRSPGKGK